MNILVTGGAGFIGSNLVDRLLADERVTRVRVLDDLSAGDKANLEAAMTNSNFEFIEGDIRDEDVCNQAMSGIDLVSHQAAMGSVPRSIAQPLKFNAVNITGTLNVFKAAVDQKVKRVVFAASSSIYGDNATLPKREDEIGMQLSPYALTKRTNELYADVFSRVYGFKYMALRYFNIFGPRQDPHGPYAAVIPLFFKAALHNTSPRINGDGTFSRDFTHVDNAVAANMLALFNNKPEADNKIYNVACGDRTTLNELWDAIKSITDTEAEAEYGPERAGDIPHSHADISRARTLLNYDPSVTIHEGLSRLHQWYLDNPDKM